MENVSYALGIDIHKESSTFVLVDHESTIYWTRRLKSTPKEYRSALAMLKTVVPLDGLPAAIEPVCGWKWAVQICKEHGIDIEVANPRKVRLIAESLDKTDKNDAAHLAWIRLVGKLPCSYVAPDDIAGVRRLVRGYAYLIRLRTGIKNRLQALATEDGLNIELGNVSTTTGLRLLAIARDGDATYEASITALNDLEETIAPLYRSMTKLTKEHPVIARLATIPGMGIVTATTVFAEVGDFTRFHSPKQLASFAGLVPRQRSSGDHVRYGGITKKGSDLLRHMLVEAAMHISATDEHALGLYFARMKEDHPDMAPKKLRIALARRILTVMHGMVIHETNFDPGLYDRNGNQVTSNHSLVATQ
jgi:transposase